MIKKPIHGAFERAYEAWLSQSNEDGSDSESVLQDEVSLDGAKNSKHTDGRNISHSLSRQSALNGRKQGFVRRPVRLKRARFMAYKAVLKKYRSGKLLTSKRNGLSPGCQTDDSGVVSPGNDAILEAGKAIEGLDSCLSGNDSPPNIQDNWGADGSTFSIQTHHQEHPPKLLPCLDVADSIHNVEKIGQCQHIVVHDCATVRKKPVKSPPVQSYIAKCSSEYDPFEFVEESIDLKRKGESELSPGSKRSRNSLSDNNNSLKITVRASHNSARTNKNGSLCLESPLSGDCDQTGYVVRNGCEVGGSDSGAGSQSESCCEESPRHEIDTNGHAGLIVKNKNAHFPCDNQRFTVIPSDNCTKLSASGSPPLVLKLKKCEQKTNSVNTTSTYFAVEMVKRTPAVIKNILKIDKIVTPKKSEKSESPECHNSCLEQAKPVTTNQLSEDNCTYSVGCTRVSERKRLCRSPSENHRVQQSSGGCLATLTSRHRKYIRQCIHLSVLQSKVHTLFCRLFPSLSQVLSQVSPEGIHFASLIDSVISLLQSSEDEDTTQSTDVINGALEHLSLDVAANVVETGHAVPVYESLVVLCRSPEQCLLDFREKIFTLVQLLLPELTLSIEYNLYKPHRELSKFLDKLISHNS